MVMGQILIVIPAYEPDRRMIALLKSLKENDLGDVILVNDGSSPEYDKIFSEAKKIIENRGILLKHKVNKGKGRELKKAYIYILENYDNVVGVITADSDGQHTAGAIGKIKKKLLGYPNNLILGVRDFSGTGIPWKSRFGNNLTEKIFMYIAGIHVSDTQTGLRGIPKEFMKQLLDVKGERFEFEMRMLLESAGKYQITEVAIETIYDSVENHQTHFNPVMDSIRIYRILGEKFLKYIFVSFSSSMIDILLFSVFCILFKEGYPNTYIAMATVIARVISAFYNYLLNYKIVFQSKESMKMSGMKYVFLATLQMGLSALLVTVFVNMLLIIPEFMVKMMIDVILFFVSYHIQQKYIFNSKRE